jgi:hypothetical protein
MTRKNGENECGVSFNSVADSREIGGQLEKVPVFVELEVLATS